MAGSFKIKLSPNLRPYVGRVVRNGQVQKNFAERIGKPAGACVRANVHQGMTQSAIRKAVAECGKARAGTQVRVGRFGQTVERTMNPR